MLSSFWWRSYGGCSHLLQFEPTVPDSGLSNFLHSDQLPTRVGRVDRRSDGQVGHNPSVTDTNPIPSTELRVLARVNGVSFFDRLQYLNVLDLHWVDRQRIG